MGFLHPRPDVFHPLGGHVVVRTEVTLILAEVRSLEVLGAEHPGVQILGTEAHRGLQRLLWTGTVAVEGDGVAMDDEVGHRGLVWDQS